MENMRRFLLFHQPLDAFPYWLFIEENQGKFQFLKAKDKWPGPGKNTFCLYEGEVSFEALPEVEPQEGCGIIKVDRYGKKLTLILDRKTRRRSWFIFNRKEYKSRPGEFYWQVFWVTQSSSLSERRGAYLSRAKPNEGVEVVVDIRERYAYSFAGFGTKRETLPVGDYALRRGGKILALVERKTAENIWHEIGAWDVFLARLVEMESYPLKAVVIEADYKKLLKPKYAGYSEGYLAKILADLFVKFPSIQFVFCSGRKTANFWTHCYFLRAAANF